MMTYAHSLLHPSFHPSMYPSFHPSISSRSSSFIHSLTFSFHSSVSSSHHSNITTIAYNKHHCRVLYALYVSKHRSLMHSNTFCWCTQTHFAGATFSSACSLPLDRSNDCTIYSFLYMCYQPSSNSVAMCWLYSKVM